ncbi:MAG: hypothetical protein INH41_02930 [Myxococcaceae bacterium]|jgi:hypothetical protein|nr:hypothetical protein [Myxococcaceae bacterium]MCA3011334.1 hypothetical protein [Myxococcaceae bacterium]
MRCAVLWAAGVVACTAPAPVPTPEAPPAAPVLRLPAGAETTRWRERGVTLRLDAAPGVTARLFFNGTCEGREALRVDGATGEVGVFVETVFGRNVFSADAVSSSGQVSACSVPVSLDVSFPTRGNRTEPLVTLVTPRSPTRAASVVVQGYMLPGWTVNVWAQPGCQGALLAVADAASFERPGVTVALRPEAPLTLSFDADRDGEATRCSQPLTLVQDLTAPVEPRLRWFPSPPHAFRAAALVLEGVDFNDAAPEVFPNASCAPPAWQVARLTPCAERRCPGALWPVDLDATPVVSVQLADEAGNTTRCLVVAHDATPPGPPPPFFVTPLEPVGALVVAPEGAPLPIVSLAERCEFAHYPLAPVGPADAGGLGALHHSPVDASRFFVGFAPGTDGGPCVRVR